MMKNEKAVNWSFAIAIAFCVAVFFQWTYSTAPTSDGAYWSQVLQTRITAQDIFPTHVLNIPVLFLIKSVLQQFSINFTGLQIIQITNSCMVFFCLILFYYIAEKLVQRKIIALGGMLAFGFSFGFWYFANGEIHHFGVLFLLLMFAFLVWSLGKDSISALEIIVFGVLLGLSTLFHMDSPLFLAVYFGMLVLRQNFTKAFLKSFAAGALACTVWAVGVLATRSLLGVEVGAQKTLKWVALDNFVSAGGRVAYCISIQWISILKDVKGQLTSLIFGTQALVDAVRNPSLFENFGVATLVVIALLYFCIGSVLVLKSISAFRSGASLQRTVLIGSIVWIGVYMICFNLWFAPEGTEYHIVTVPPVIFLFMIGADRFENTGQKKWLGTLLLFLLVCLTFVGNFFWGIRPWYQYGQMMERIEKRSQSFFGLPAVYLSFESGMDGIFESHGRVSLKSLFKDEPKAEAFRDYRELIRSNLEQGKPVYGYNLIPGNYALKAFRALRDAGERYEADEFKIFLDGLMRDFNFQPMFSYWEVNYEPLYLFGKKQDYFWKITNKTNK